jgi:D-alanyl-lipoteichoic acid acyltransferase DltB (MBOAT superfamily)
MDIIDKIKNLCAPSLIYLVVSLVMLITKRNEVSVIITDIIVTIVLTYLLDYVCKKYGQNMAWYGLIIMIVLPAVLSYVTFRLLIRQITGKKK